MAERDCSADTDLKEVISHAAHRIKVSYASTFPDYEKIPSLNLKGKWMAAAGFGIGTQVDVRVMEGCLVITSRQPEPEKPEESELMKSLRQACKFSARKQRQIQEFIEVIGGRRV
ncbi:endoribonuclease SymE [Pantoea sp. BAV 3049]|uniref:endoribonuclease SymE n=1 Tax=Pantoea sp. BAV 3049 TaxID=2654188 RepID=UPI00131E57F1|nr:endoribonuclease SymE [Pantoea sp. BAV 3049]